MRRGNRTATHRYRWLCDEPLRGDAKAMSVNWLEMEIADAKGTITYRNSFITDLPVHRDNVAELAACGRARWKIENETFNVLKTKGYDLERNFGHGKRHLTSTLATLDLLAFAVHTVCDLGDRAWKAARRELVVRRGPFRRSPRSPPTSCSHLGRNFSKPWCSHPPCRKDRKPMPPLAAAHTRNPPTQIENCCGATAAGCASAA